MEHTALRNVLVIAYYFPPMGLSGVQRTLKFVKYLPQFGWQPTVLTVTPTGYYAQDYTLLDELHHQHIEIVRTGSLDPNRLFRKKGVVKMPSERWRKMLTFISDTFFIPDNKIGWKRKALKAAEKLYAEKKFDVIFSTAPPFTDFIIGTELHKKFRTPLVLDYRDVWHEYPYKYYPTPLHKLMSYKLEKKALRASARIITTNRRVKELILKRYKFLHYHDITILPQGFDPEDVTIDAKHVIPPSKGLRIAHAGVFYGERTPKYLLLALRKLFAAHPKLKHEIEVVLIGTIQDEYLRMIKSMELDGNIITTGYLDHKHCIAYLQSSDILWLMLNNDTQSPGKLYEYIGLRKPILASVPEGFVRQTLKETEGAVIVDPENVGDTMEAILRLHELHKQGEMPHPNEEIVQKYNRVELTNELSKILGFLSE
jgi:glycosyltransferase involved in cell wall biosynthesis